MTTESGWATCSPISVLVHVPIVSFNHSNLPIGVIIYSRLTCLLSAISVIVILLYGVLRTLLSVRNAILQRTPYGRSLRLKSTKPPGGIDFTRY
ncbi:hypothetical protein BDY21DRAFT_143099 [Lineolata rhizophorae]|uniref:Uncharacterized protein n=1 Tax=Lineolata rhizophorae TaxID=578093 RepID=A0A6A6NNF1_9PEZI|nr:hypothetical protein BDY21DRAFT_143099 [Lineolata rhizophorae]